MKATKTAGWLKGALAAVLLLVAWGATATARPPLPGSAVGIKVTVTEVRNHLLEADMDLTWYTRVGPYPSTLAGYPAIGYPALDYGDGSTLSYTTLALASSGGGPGGSNVYRNLASFTHTYPAPGTYTITGASICTFCYRTQYVFFPPGSPVPTTFSYSYDYVPQTVVGNLAATYKYSGTTDFFDYSVRYAYTVYLAVTNTTQVMLRGPLSVPAASTWGLVALGALLALGGLAVLRRG